MGTNIRKVVSGILACGFVVAAFSLTWLVGAPLAHAADKWWETSTTNIYTIYPYWSAYTSKYPNTTLKSLTQRLNAYKSQGFNALLFQPLNAGDATDPTWGGLATLEHTDIADNVGSLADYRTLLSEAHRRGMKILLFYNLGYSSKNADFFLKAADDYRNGVSSPERNWFAFSRDGTDPKPPGAEWQWVWSDRANAYYLTRWGPAFPAYNWGHQDWRDKAKSIIKFWMDLGTDGMSFDAPAVYYGGDTNVISRAVITEYITGVVNSYTDVDPLGYPEGIGHGPDWISDYHWQGLEDYVFSAQWTRPTPLADAIINTHNPAALEGILNSYRDTAVNVGGIFWSALSWGRLGSQPILTPAQRALEAATVASVGALLDWHDTQDTAVFEFWNSWSVAERRKIFNIQKAGRDNPALGAAGARLKLPTNDDNAYYAFKRTSKNGAKAALVVLNFRDSRQTVTVDLAGSGIGRHTPTDLINGGGGAPIKSSTYSITLPAYGYTFLGLRRPHDSGGTLRGESTNTPTSTNLSAVGVHDWVHWGLDGAVGAINRKSGVTPRIRNFMKLGAAAAAGFRGNLVNYSWSDGTPTANAATDAGIFVPRIGGGFRITVPADTTQRRLRLYVGAWQARARVHASLSDGSSPAFTDYYDSSPISTNKVYTLDFRAGSANQSLIVDVTVDRPHDFNNGNVTLQAATLSTGPGG